MYPLLYLSICAVVTSMEVYRLDLGYEYNSTINLAWELPQGNYDTNLTFHAFWSGTLNEKHLISIKSCYQFNVKGRSNRKIILWVNTVSDDSVSNTIKNYAYIQQFNFNTEVAGTPFENKQYHVRTEPGYFSDIVRYIILYKYGGFWFDLDMFFLRSIDPVLLSFGDRIIVYNWSGANWPNGAIFFNPYAFNPKMKHFIEYMIARRRGFGFQESNLTYDNPVDLFVLPCSWFDSWFIYTLYSVNIMIDTDSIYTFKNFSYGSFTYHWHNKWDQPIGPHSILRQLSNLLTEC